jgi:serine/threonine-protein kinase RsbW
VSGETSHGTVQALRPDVRRLLGRLTLSNALPEVARAGRWAVGLATAEGFSASDASRVDLVLSEALTNVIAYGYPEDREDRIDLVMERIGSDLSLRVRDHGRPFDPSRAAPRVAAGSLEEARVGGLGIHLMKHYSDDFRYARECGSNALTLTFRPRVRPSATAQP